MKRDEYDVIIIGAGIGGLVCGCYLAKEGKKVLIVEKNSRVGGYCKTFKSSGYMFDAFVHSLGNLSFNGEFSEVLNDLGIKKNLCISRSDPSDIIISPNNEIKFWNDTGKLIGELSSNFSKEEKNIRFFFNELVYVSKMDSVVKYHNKSFERILNDTFNDAHLKKILSLIILGNLGTPPNLINAFTAIKHYRQFVVDGGYFLDNGMQALPDALMKRFENFGGKVLLSGLVKRICLHKKIACGVKLNDSREFKSSIVVSGCDARHTFLDLVGEEFLSHSIKNKMYRYSPSLSLFILCLGISNHCLTMFPDRVNVWLMLDYNYSDMHCSHINHTNEEIKWIMIRANHSDNTVTIYCNAPFVDVKFWKQKKRIFEKKILTILEEKYPILARNIQAGFSFSPIDLNRWTLNSEGAAYGWASTLRQFMDLDFMRDGIIENLFLCGHWSTIAQGVSGVAVVGRRAGKLIINGFNKRTVK